MPYSEKLDERILSGTAGWRLVRKKMFGGTCYLLNGNMTCGVYRDFLIVRLGEREGEKALAEPFTRVFDITGRPMKGWVMIEEAGFKGARLKRWLDRAKAFAESLPKK